MAKRRAQGTGSIFKRTVNRNGKEYIYWCCEVSTGFDLAGKPIKKQYSFGTQAEAVGKLNEVNLEIQQQDYLEPSKITLSSWLDIFIDEYCKKQKYLTVKGYKAQINTHIKPKLGTVKLSKLTPAMVQKFYNQLAVDGKEVQHNEKGKTSITHEPLSAKIIKNIHNILNLALETAINQGYLKKNPCSKAILPKITKPEINPLNDEQIKDFLKECEEDSLGKLLKFILFTGLRESEALGLTWDCVDWKKSEIKVNKQLVKHTVEDGGYKLEETKTGKIRYIQVAPSVMAILKVREAEDITNRLKASSCWEGWQNKNERKTALVFTNELGKHLTPKATYLHCKNICKRINAPNVTVHGLRHTFATISLQNGDDLKTVSQNLGHSTITITGDVYAHVSDQMKKDSASRMEAFISKMA